MATKDVLNKATKAFDAAMKKMPKEKMQQIIDKVTAMNIKGPTIDEYFANFDVAGKEKSTAIKFSEWLYANRWFTFENGKWRYTFEHGTVMRKEEYNKNYTKTTEELYELFKKEF